MVNNKFIKISVSVFIVLIALWFATTEVYTNGFLPGNHNSLSIDAKSKLESASPENSDMDEYSKPVYFNIFKFVNNFIPVKREN